MKSSIQSNLIICWLKQVSHHPTLIACHCEGRGWKFWGDSNLRSKFWGRSIQIDPVGVLTLEFDDGEIFQWSKVCIVAWLHLCKISTAQLYWSSAFLFCCSSIDILKHDHAVLRSLQLSITLSLVNCIVITMGQCKYVVIATIHATSSLKSSLFLTEILGRLVLHSRFRIPFYMLASWFLLLLFS